MTCDGAVVGEGQFVVERGSLDLDDVGPGIDRPVTCSDLAGRHLASRAMISPSTADGQRGPAVGRRPWSSTRIRRPGPCRRCRSAANRRARCGGRSRRCGRKRQHMQRCAQRPSASALAGASWASPSVIMMAPATRSEGTSARRAAIASNRRVPSPGHPCASRTSTTRGSTLLSSPKRARPRPAPPGSPWRGRRDPGSSPRSTTSETTSCTGSRSSATSDRVGEGHGQHDKRQRAQDGAAAAPARAAAPAASAASRPAATSQGRGSSGAKVSDHIVYCPSRSSNAGTWTWSAL
jgi:hypothetical protein